ncbi:hypothetical protein BJ138DRAFT_1020203, partial [Hygrophoropsis aurantiaca]
MLVWIKSALSPQAIRDRLMDPSSLFQKKMVEYLEGVHIGEFISSSSEEVKSMLDNKMVDDTLPTAVETMPVPPPVCKAEPQCSEAKNCNTCVSWVQYFKDTTNEILMRCNTHRCSGKPTDTTNTRHENKGQNKYQPTVGCCSNKWGRCKARFPRETQTQTCVDPTTGALLMKKGEAMMNFFTALVTYLFRCNTDVTSMLSGTAIKAVVAYISDYISKPTLKTYVVFDTIKSVFDKNTTLLSSSIERGEKARKIMTQIINSLTSKMEIGAPMASLYLLGNPDHYTSHTFTPLYWKSYVKEAKRFWEDNNDDPGTEDNLVLRRIRGSVVGTSPVFDYIFRPIAFEHMSLYDWVCCYEKTRIPKKDKRKKKQTMSERSSPKYSDFHRFCPEHPLYESHHARVLLQGEGKVPNFVGGSLPRHDKGDIEYYSATMLTLFVPWRSGQDLKACNKSWHEQFKDQIFTARQTEIMGFFNVRYECLDARDDYSAQLRADAMKIPMGEWAGDLHEWEADDQWLDSDPTFPLFDADCIIDTASTGRLTSKWNYDKAVIQQMLESCGWLSQLSGVSPLPEIEKFHISKDISSSDWKTLVKKLKEQALENKLAHMTNVNSRQSVHLNQGSNNENPNEVRVVDSSYLLRSFRPKLKKDQELVDRIVTQYSMNEEQERAFRIIANHAT